MRIVAVAILQGEVIWTLPPPARHHHVIRAIYSVHPERPIPIGLPEEQGFLLSDGTFASREAAGAIALANGQFEGPLCAGQLFSEDLW